MDLVTQQEGMKTSSFRNRIVCPDIEGSVFEKRWSSLPMGLKAQLLLFVPIYVVYLLFFGTRKTLAENIALEDLPSTDELLLQDERFEKLDSLLVDQRDRELIANIKKLHDNNREDKKLVGVVYGAMHMRNLINFLLQQLHYKVAKAEWVTVFEL